MYVCVYLLYFDPQRPGAFAVYLEPWHPDIIDFLDLKKNHGAEEKVHQSSLPFSLSPAPLTTLPHSSLSREPVISSMLCGYQTSS